MTIDTARLRALAEAAAPGPWSVHGNGKDEWYVYALDARYGPQSVYGESPVKVAWVPCAPFGGRNARDCAYIAAASPDAILAILDERDALAAMLKDCTTTLNTISSMAGSAHRTMSRDLTDWSEDCMQIEEVALRLKRSINDALDGAKEPT
jgi:hypothetical protein